MQQIDALFIEGYNETSSLEIPEYVLKVCVMF
jgi:hypothetical protein